VTIPDFPIAQFVGLGRWVARIDCRQCAWSALMRGDDATEVGAFLRARAIEHLCEQHPEGESCPAK
jgi:hypothetical protein